MKAHEASAVHALLLIGLGLWGYFDTGANTAFIPVIMGSLLIIMVPGVKKENKVIAHIAVLVTLLAVLGVTKPLMAQIDKGDTMGMIRTGIMLVAGIYAMFTFIQSFRAARKARG